MTSTTKLKPHAAGLTDGRTDGRWWVGQVFVCTVLYYTVLVMVERWDCVVVHLCPARQA